MVHSVSVRTAKCCKPAEPRAEFVQRELQAALDALSQGRTTLTIAHRLSTIRDADQIAVLDHGRIVETGTHTELVERGGRYAQLAATDELIDRNQLPVAA